MLSTDIYGETLVIMSVRSGNAKMFHSVVGRLTEDQARRVSGERVVPGVSQVPGEEGGGGVHLLTHTVVNAYHRALVIDR